MKKWLRRIRAAVSMGLLWAVPWAIVAVLIGLVVYPTESLVMWWVIGAYPGFLGGVLFSIVLSIAERHRRLNELSVRRFGAWGAVAGLVIGVLPFMLGTPSAADVDVARLATVVIGSITFMSAVSAAGSLALARSAEKREMLRAGADAGDMRLRDGE